MSIAKNRQDTYQSMPKHIVDEQAKHLIRKCDEYCKHTINKFKVFVWENFAEVVNTESLCIKCFDSENEAVNYCLDFYNHSKTLKTGRLF